MFSSAAVARLSRTLVRPLAGSSSAWSASARPFATSFRLPDPALAGDFVELTKIVATIGPTSEQAGPLQAVTEAGMKIMRLNFSHATVEEVEMRCTNLDAAEHALSPASAPSLPAQTTRAILLDTKGPEIRSGKLAHDESGHETMTLQAGSSILLGTDAALQQAGSTLTNLFVDYPSLATAVTVGGKVLLDDGAIVLTVTSIVDGTTVECFIDNTGDLRSRAGVNLPLADTSDLPALSDKDKQDIAYGLTKDIDYVAASFVQTAAGVREIRAYIEQAAAAQNWPADKPLPLIISKIESASALSHFDEILAESDGIMVARGDLGVEIPLTQVCNAQKEMVHACNAAGKPVIVATQMLESMAKNPRPTRAEVADVTNACYDGADCTMLSGESAKGKYPDTSVRTMREIIHAAEVYQATHELAATQPTTAAVYKGDGSTASSIAESAVALSKLKEHIKAIVVTDDTNHCQLAKITSAFRPWVPIFALCTKVKSARQLQVYRGIHPVIVNDTAEGVGAVASLGLLDAGDFVAVLAPTKLEVVQV